MPLRKCPRCELNYILDDGALCSVCREEVHGKKTNDDEDSLGLCSVCGEETALPGEDMCAKCLEEFKDMDKSDSTDNDDEDKDIDPADLDNDSVTDLEEIEGFEDSEEYDDEDGEDEDKQPEDEYARAQ